MDISVNLLNTADLLRKRVSALMFREDRKWIYNPLEYAWKPYQQYVEKYARSKKRAVFLGMNPGPWGMAQTGIPFGEVSAVVNWLGIDAEIGKPALEHPKRPVDGYLCSRSEVSGRRLWGLMQQRFGNPENFFAQQLVLNYCPLVFMEESGKNLTPDKLTIPEREALDAVCDAHLVDVIAILKPEFLVGVGKYAEKKLRNAISAMSGDGMQVVSVLHPSPASPAANRGWAQAAEEQLRKAGVWD